MARRDRKAHTNPFRGQRVVRTHEMAAAFPVERLRDLGATDDELNAAKVAWDTLTPEQQAQSAAMMAEQTDDDLRDMIEADRLAASDEVLQSIGAWAEHAVAEGTYPDTDHALDALDDWADAVEDAAQQAVCLICADLPPETVAALPSHTPEQHSGNAILQCPVDPVITENPAPDVEAFTVEWWAAAGYAVLAMHDDEGQVARFDLGADELQPLVGVPTPPEAPEAEPNEAEPEQPTPAVALGADGEQSEAPANGAPEAGAEPAPDGGGYPADGSVSDVLNWVSNGEDMTARARYALSAEALRDAPRKGVTDPLTKIAGSADA